MKILNAVVLIFIAFFAVSSGQGDISGPIKHSGGKCIHPKGGKADPPPGTEIVTYNGCGGDKLKFTLSANGDIIHTTSGLCLVPRSKKDNPHNNDRVVFGPCNTSYSKWRLTGGYIQHQSSGKCWHPYWGSANPSNDNPVVVHSGCDSKRLKYQFIDVVSKDCWESDTGGFPDSAILAQFEYTTDGSCMNSCKERPDCHAAVLTPNGYDAACYLVSDTIMEGKIGWRTASRTCFTSERANKGSCKWTKSTNHMIWKGQMDAQTQAPFPPASQQLCEKHKECKGIMCRDWDKYCYLMSSDYLMKHSKWNAWIKVCE